MSPNWSDQRSPLYRRLLGLAILLRVAVPAWALRAPERLRFNDDYLGLGRLLFQGQRGEALFPPGYIALAGGADHLFGESAVAVLVALQVVVGLLSLVLVRRIGLALSGSVAAANLGVLVAAFNPLSIVASALVLSDAVYSFLLLAAVDRWLAIRRSRPLIQASLAGVFVGLAQLTRAVGAVAIVVMFAAAALRRPRRRGVVAAIVLALAAFAVTLPARVRSWSRESTFALSASGGFNFAVLVIGPARQRWEGRERMLRASQWEEGQPGAANHDPHANAATVAGRAWQWGTQHPWLVISEVVRAQSQTWIAPWAEAWRRVGGAATIGWPWLAALAGLRIAVLGLALAAVFRPYAAVGRYDRCAVFVLAVLHVVATGSAVSGRFSVPIVPYLDVLAGMTLWSRFTGSGAA